MIDQLFVIFASKPMVFTVLVFAAGLLVGSFLNVVIYRLPVMLKRDWQAQCRELLEPEKCAGDSASDEEAFNLVVPRSRCSHCGHRISTVENIPILSWLILRGRCSSCGVAISARYPVIELATAVLSAVVAWRFGFGWPAAFALLFTWALIALAAIDIDEKLLPDSITLPLMWLGLIVSLLGLPVFADVRSAVIGAVAGYMVLWLLFHVFRLVTGKEGMGYGDFKLLAALGAWAGWQSLPLTILLSTVVGAVVGIVLIIVGRRDRQTAIPFGPYLAAAGWISLLWGDQITGLYLATSGLQ